MACSVCGNKQFKNYKHLPLPDGRKGWIELSEFTKYCSKHAMEEAIKIDQSYQKAKETVKNG